MKKITLVPGSSEWIKSRSASKAAAMMGVDPKTTRNELLKMMATGIGKEFTEWQQRMLLDKGIASEPRVRAIAEEMIGDDLSPACATDDEGYLTAAPDGVTFGGKIGFEAKAWNKELVADILAGELKPERYWQLEQQCLVWKLDGILFCSSDGTPEKFASLFYEPVPGRAEKLLAGWKMFDEDLANYKHVEAAPEVVAEPIADLPALCVEISGSVTASNLVEWKGIVTARIASINTDLQTDQDFADADKMVKFLDDGEKRIDLVKSQAQANAADIDRVFRALDEIKASMRAKRLELDKLVTKRKETIRIDIQQKAFEALRDHISALSKRIQMELPPINANFAAVMKNKRTVASLRDAVDTELRDRKIEASAIADRMEESLKLIDEAGYEFLFKDRPALAFKAADDLALVIKTRIAEHKTAEAKRLEEEREKIRKEEEAKAEAKAQKSKDAEVERIQKASMSMALPHTWVTNSTSPMASNEAVKEAAQGMLSGKQFERHPSGEGLVISGATGITVNPGSGKSLAELYGEIIMAVHRKFPNETRHQTALRYIRERESVADGAAMQCHRPD